MVVFLSCNPITVQERLLAVVDDREIEAKKNIVEKEGQLAEARKDETDLFTLVGFVLHQLPSPAIAKASCPVQSVVRQ